MDLARLLIFFLLLISAAYTDLKNGTIPNRITYSGTLCGIFLGAISGGIEPLISSIAGLIIGFLPLYLVYRSGGIGAGDVKLMGMVGALCGTRFVIYSFLYSSFAGFIMALIKLTMHRELKPGLKRSMLLFASVFGAVNKDRISDKDRKPLTIPYGLAIVLGSFAAFFIESL